MRLQWLTSMSCICWQISQEHSPSCLLIMLYCISPEGSICTVFHICTVHCYQCTVYGCIHVCTFFWRGNGAVEAESECKCLWLCSELINVEVVHHFMELFDAHLHRVSHSKLHPHSRFYCLPFLSHFINFSPSSTFPLRFFSLASGTNSTRLERRIKW